ncbi:MAG TPA: tail fiber domain-containing protein, partial [Candidatus Acidoferrum sp.]|nr:tail fiber domain-containing protein [Candidatus Acidoferrum sp.]
AFVWADTAGTLSLEDPFVSTAPRQFLIRAEGGVGIGHNAPDAPLHVVGGSDAGLGGGGTFVLGAVSGLNMALDGNEIVARNNGAASPLFLNAGGGNVAIGHNAPDAPLHVVGGLDAELGGGGTFVLGAVSGLNMALDGNEIVARNNGAASPLFLNAGGGNVGIGSTTADAPLHVVGGLGVSSASGGTLILGSGDGINMAFDSNDIQARDNSVASTLSLNRGGGNVGIGNTFPVAPLHVVGGSDVSPSEGGTLVVGSVNSNNIAIDGNEIMARNDGSNATLFLNASGPFAGGNVSIGTTASTALLRVGAATCNGSAWNNASDRNLKGGFTPVNTRDVLEKVAALPISQWNYTNAPGARHIGPMAQDFQAAFGVGDDDKTIATIDADGVALAAIQGLNALLKAQAAELHLLKEELTELRRAVSRQAEHSSAR